MSKNNIEVEKIQADTFLVTIKSNTVESKHTVHIDRSNLDLLGLENSFMSEILVKSFEFLLDREPASAILPEFTLADVERYFPEFPAEIKRQL